MNRQERVAYNARKRKVAKVKFIILAVLCIISATLRYYRDGYRDTGLVQYFVMGFGGLGWLILFFVFGWKEINSKDVLFEKNQTGWFKQKFKRVTLFIICAVVSAGYVIAIDKLSDKRIHQILTTEPTNITNALVTGIQQRQSRGGIYYVAVIEYEANGVRLQKVISETSGKYQPGEKYTLKYSVEYPEMFEFYGSKKL